MSHRVLVTGGAGFIGSHLCEALLKQGNEVICLDNFFTGSKENVRHLHSDPRFTLLQHDITEPVMVEVDRIYNLACPASPVHYQSDPIKTIKTSVLGALHVLGIANRTGARVLQASTSEVYGDPSVHPQSESYWGNVNCFGERSCYDEGKRVAESLFWAYRSHNDVDIRIARIFNTYGPRMAVNDGRVVSNFIVQALRGEVLTIYGDGSQTRSFCYVDDLVGGLTRLMEAEDVSGPINLGNPAELTVAELAELVREILGRPVRVVCQALPADDPQQRCPDIATARGKLGWEPKVELRAGLANTIEYFKTRLAAG